MPKIVTLEPPTVRFITGVAILKLRVMNSAREQLPVWPVELMRQQGVKSLLLEEKIRA